jgi:hypothetical protein
MASAQDYASWIVKNADKKGTPEFDTVVKAYQAAKSGAAPAAAATAPAMPSNEGMPAPRVNAPEPTPSFADQASDALGYVGRTLRNVPESAGNLVGETVSAIAHPITSAQSLADTAAGAARAGFKAVLPEKVFNFIDSIDNPETTQRIATTASNVGGHLANRYGSAEAIKNTIEKDPVGAAADISVILGGGEAALKMAGETGAANRLATAANMTNPLTPVAAGVNKLVGTAAPYAVNTVRNMSRPTEKILSGVLEDRGPEYVAALRRQAEIVPGSVPTAGEVIAGMDQPGTLLPALQAKVAKGVASTPYEDIAAAQREAQIKSIQSIGQTPADLAEAIKARGETTAPMYEGVKVQQGPINTQPVIDVIDKAVKENPLNRPLVSALTGLKDNISKSANAGDLSSALDDVKAMLGSQDNKFIKGQLTDVKDALSAALPGYGEAQAKFKEMSQPVNTMQIGQQLEGALTSPLSENQTRPGVFANAVANAPTTIKKATGDARFATLSDALETGDSLKVSQVLQDLSRTQEFKALAAKGAEQVKDLGKAAIPRSPSFFSAWATMANKVMDALEGKINQKAAMEIADAMMRPETAATAIEKAMREVQMQKAIEEAYAKRGQTAAGVTRSAVVGAPLQMINRNALAPQPNQNALAQ